MFDIIKPAHVVCGHGGRDKMTKALNKYANITRDSIELYKSLCVQCQQKRKRATTKGVVVSQFCPKTMVPVFRLISLTCSLCARIVSLDYGLSRPLNKVLCITPFDFQTCC